jgi:hypothetical protein
MRERIKKNAIILIILLAVWSLPNVSAKYLNQKRNANTARVAAFKITDEGSWSTYADATISPGNTISNKSPVKITNASEVAVECTITIKRYSNNIKSMVPEKITLDDTDLTLNNNSDTWTYTQTLQPSEEMASNLIIYWKSSDEKADENLNYRGMVDYFTVTVSANQVD